MAARRALLVLIGAMLLIGPASVFAQTAAEPPEPNLQVRDDRPEPRPAPEREIELPEGEPASEGDVVDELRVTGNRRVEAESVLNQVRTKVGQPIRPETISEDIKRIYRLGYFDDVRVDATRTTDGSVVVTYIVEEKPAITRIEYVGNDELSLEDIQEVVNLETNQVLSVADVKANAEKIRELYSEKGFYLAEVGYDIADDDEIPGGAVVTFEIREYAKVEVRKITLLGNKTIPDRELKNIMATREGDFTSLVTQFGTFKEEQFEADLQRLNAYYYDKGFVEVSVSRPVIRLSRDKRYIFITIEIKEGPQFTTGNVELQGDFIVPKSELEELVELQSGETFSYGTARKDAEKIRNVYMDAGFAYANVNPLMLPRQSGEKIVDVTYDIQKGNKVYFGRIEVVGNTKTRDKVIRRELEIEEGELYSSTAVEASKTKVQRLGFFESVNITTQRSDRPDVINARVEVTERPTGTFQIGAGLSSLESFILNGQVSQNNFLGRGQSLSFNVQASAIRTFFNFQFSEPWLFDSRVQFSLDLYNFDFLFQDFGRRSRGGNLSFGYPLTDELSVSMTYKLEDVTLSPGGRSGRESQQVGNLFRGGLTSSLRLGVTYDNRDNRLFPTKGGYHSVRAELADDGITLSQNEFAKYDGETRWYFPLFWNFVLRLNGEVGYVQSVDAHKPVPLFERYFAGGPQTVRGFDRYSLGPSRDVAGRPGDPSSFLDDFQIGGNKRLIPTAEIEFPILTAIGIKGVVFADAGNAFDNDQPLALNLDLFADDENDYNDVLRTAVGWGFRWFSPIGPLRFEWGVPLARLRDEEPLVFEFSLGSPF
jgi:outer membrane protein insertion porin family